MSDAIGTIVWVLLVHVSDPFGAYRATLQEFRSVAECVAAIPRHEMELLEITRPDVVLQIEWACTPCTDAGCSSVDAVTSRSEIRT